VNKPMGWRAGRAQAPRLARDESVAEAKRDDAPLFFVCGCDLCWHYYFSAGDDCVPKAYRYDSYEIDDCILEARVCDTPSNHDLIPCSDCDKDASYDETELAVELASKCGSEEMSWEVVSDACDSDLAWEYLDASEQNHIVSTHISHISDSTPLGVGASYAQVLVASL